MAPATSKRGITRRGSVTCQQHAGSQVVRPSEPRLAQGRGLRVIAHVGGRDADLNYARDIGSSTSLSCIRLGARLADACRRRVPQRRSERPAGERRPGASTFGAIGGLSCYFMHGADARRAVRCADIGTSFSTCADLRSRGHRSSEDSKLGPANQSSSVPKP